MDYKVEVMVDKQVIFSHMYSGYSHPNQVIKLALKEIDKRYDYMSIFVMNKYGEVWNYVIERKMGKALPMIHDYKSKKDVLLVFSGNASIFEVLGGVQ